MLSSDVSSAVELSCLVLLLRVCLLFVVSAPIKLDKSLLRIDSRPDIPLILIDRVWLLIMFMLEIDEREEGIVSEISFMVSEFSIMVSERSMISIPLDIFSLL